MYNKKRVLSDVDFSGCRRVVLRLDLNVPIQGGKITDNNRIKQTFPTIDTIFKNNVQLVVLSHLSRIKSIDDIKSGKKSLRLVFEEFKKLMPNRKISFIDSTDFDHIKRTIESDKETNIFILENTRYYDVDSSGNVVKRESKNDSDLAKFWASLGDVFVNDAFGTTHRKHASNVGISGFLPSAMGLLIEKELKNLSFALESKKHPKVLILGGSKVSDKLKLINSIAPKVDKILIGGGMVYTFLKSMGREVGKSIVEEDMLKECDLLLKKYESKIFLPIDHLVSREFKDIPGTEKDVADLGWGDMMALDIGPRTAQLYSNELSDAQIVIWNGPMGVFEFDNYSQGTLFLARKLSEITKDGTYTVIGGGDSAAAVEKFGLSGDMSFISTGGGASLAFFEGSPLPGIESISDK